MQTYNESISAPLMVRITRRSFDPCRWLAPVYTKTNDFSALTDAGDKGHGWRQAAIWLSGLASDWSHIRCGLVSNRLRWKAGSLEGVGRETEEGRNRRSCTHIMHYWPAGWGIPRWKGSGVLCHKWKRRTLRRVSRLARTRGVFTPEIREVRGEITDPTPRSWRISSLPLIILVIASWRRLEHM